MKVETKLIFGFLIIYLLFGSAIFISIYESSKALERTASNGLLSFGQELSAQIDGEINERVEDFEAYSKDILLQQSLVESNDEFKKLDNIQAYISQKDLEWASASKNEITPFMRELIGNQLSKELQEKIKFYEGNLGYRLYGEVFVTNKYGANAAQTGKTTDYRQDDEEWWQNAKTGEVYLEDVEYDQSADVYSIAMGIRVDDPNGDFVGVIKAVLNIDAVIRIIREAEAEKRYNSAEFTLVDGKGRIIFSTTKYEIFQPFEFYQLVEDKPSVSVAKDPQTGTEKVFVHVHSEDNRDLKKLGWLLVMQADRDEIVKPIHNLIIIILIFAIILIVTAVVIGFYIYSTISQSLRKFEGTINEISKGNLDARVDIRSKDEFYTLSLAFNSMADQLKIIKKVEKKQKMQKELEALKASYKTGFVSEEFYNKERRRLEENVIRANAVDSKTLQEKGLIKKEE